MMVVVVVASDLFDDGGVGVRQRRRYVALEVGRDARVATNELVEGRWVVLPDGQAKGGKKGAPTTGWINPDTQP
jgi:hypothetical protein